MNMTIKQAKEICIAKNGHLPRVGEQVLVHEDEKCKVWLANNCGHYGVYTFVK